MEFSLGLVSWQHQVRVATGELGGKRMPVELMHWTQP